MMRGAEPFFFPGGERGALLLHGFTGTPAEMRLAGEFLNRLGYTVLGPRLAGHGTSPEELAGTVWRHWYADAEDGFYLLRGLCREVAVVGLSMGGLLALRLAAEYPVDRVVAVNAPIFLRDRRVRLLPVYRLFQRYALKKRRPLAVNDAYSISYEQTPLASVASLLELVKATDGLLSAVAAPTLLIQSRNDGTVRPDSAEYIYRRLGCRDRRLVWLERSGHVATIDVEYQRVFDEIAGFFAADTTNK